MSYAGSITEVSIKSLGTLFVLWSDSSIDGLRASENVLGTPTPGFSVVTKDKAGDNTESYEPRNSEVTLIAPGSVSTSLKNIVLVSTLSHMATATARNLKPSDLTIAVNM
ncbi:Zn-dependent protease, putative [Babesia ovis]|uniref:Zn-dependent protease, putative n=1 Tax=Babesia ovis TaxID=5869 RepID=A0A9W5TD24_BABOV|nr:Zn-dependent protease, putative [Babesia ovis]